MRPDRTFLVSALENADWTTRRGPTEKQHGLLRDAVQQAALLACNPYCRAVAIRSCTFTVAGGSICSTSTRETDSRWVPAAAIVDAAASLDDRSRAALALKLLAAPYDLNPGKPPLYVRRNSGGAPVFCMVPYDPDLGPAPG